MKKHIFANKRRMLSLFILAILACEIVISPIASAAGSLVTAHQDDVYTRLEEAAKLNVITNNLIKCFNAGSKYNYVDHGYSALSGSDAADGKVFYKPGISYLTNTEHSTSLWLEDEIQNNGGDNGTIWCWQGQSEGRSVFQLFAKAIGKSAKEILCKDGKGRIYQRAKAEYMSYDATIYTYAEDKNCSSFNDTGASYIQKSDWSTGLQEVYDAYVTESGNPYLPAWGEIGSFDNVDGYFNYLMDFEKKCGYDVYDTEPSDTTVYPITRYDKSTNKIVAKKRYIHVSDNKSGWTALSSDNSVTSCTGFLERIEALRGGSNGIVHSINDADDTRGAGYEGIILAKLREECNGLKDEEGNNAWESMKTKLQEIIDSEDAADTLKQEAQDSLEKINNANGNYVEESGSETDPEGKIYQCLDIAQMNLIFDEYEYGAQDFGTATKEPSCFDNTGALGWVLCPLTEQGGKMVISFYNNLIEPFLMIDVGVFSGTHTTTMTGDHANNGLYSVWQFFQFLANLAFVGIFIFIIISQITGFGIDNYGIKKVLPKLIMGAILINASYVICQLSVEVANILGVGIKNLFSGIDVGLTEIEMSGVDNASVSLGSGVAAGAGLVLVVAIIALLIKNAVLALDKVVVAILMMIIIVMISVLFLFVVLSLRYALTILLVVVSPLAFACYMLPNTKKIFDQWFNLFKGLLLAYPISSAMVFGGQFVGEILIAANATGQGAPMVLLFSAAIMSIAPVFLIPSTIKKSMGAIGGLVDRMQGRAKGYAGRQRGAMDHAMDRSRMGQHFQNKRMESDRNKMIGNAKRTQEALEKKRANGTLSKADERRLVRAQGILAHDARENQEAYRTGLFGNMSQGNSFDDENTILGQFRGDDMFMEPNGKGKMELNADKAVAALDSIADADKLTAAYGALSATSGFQEKMAGSAEFRSRVAGVLSAKGDPINKSIAKLVMAGGVETQGADGKTTHSYSLSNMAQGGGKSQLASKIQGLGNSAMVGMDKDAFNTQISIGDGSTVSAASLFSDSQWASGMGQSGKALENYSAQIADMSSEQQSQILGNASINDIGNITPEAILAFGGYKPESGKTYADAAAEITANNGDLSKVSDEIRHAAEEGARKINESSTTAIEQIKTTSGDAARAGMNQIAAQMLQIKTDQRPVDVRVTIDHNGGTTSPSGGHAGPNSDPMDAPVG